MWKHKTLGFVISNVNIKDGWATFISSGVPTTLDENKFKLHYEKC